MKLTPVSVAMAVIHQDRSFLMQLRDDKEDILYPGQWGLFGGHLEPGESPEQGFIREIWEEITYRVERPTFWTCYEDSEVIRHMFVFSLETSLESLQLTEGQDLDFVPIESIIAGRHYSHKLREERYLGQIHRQILLDFAQSHF